MAYDPDRLSRDLLDLLLLESEFTRRGVRLEFITQEVDTSPEGRMFFSMRGVVAQFEREKIRERSMRGLREKARQGKTLGGSCAPMGYRYDSERGTLEEVPEKAQIVRFIFFTFANEDLSLLGLANRLNRLHMPTPGGGDRWRASTLSTMLRNETYAGRLHQFRRYRIEPRSRASAITRTNKTSTAIRPREEWVTVPVPALIPPELFESVQRKLAKNAELARRNTKREYLLSGVLRCGRCNGRMGGHTVHGIPYYRCYRNGRPDNIPLSPDGQPIPCDCPEVQARIIEPPVWEAICRLVKEPDWVIQELHGLTAERSETREALERELWYCSNKLKVLPREQDRLVEGYGKGLYSDDLMRAQMEKIAREQGELERRKGELERELHEQLLTDIQEDRIKDLLDRIGVGLDNLDFGGRQELIRLLVERVSFNGSSVEIHTIIRPDVQLRPTHRGGLRG